MTESKMTKRDRLIPWYIVSFFVVVAIVDGIFVYIATSTHTGVVTEHAYDQGLAYNKTVAASDAQDALGWQSKIVLGADSVLTFSLSDADGQMLEGAAAKAVFTRPTKDGMDFSIELSEQAPGQYVAPVAFPADGQWDVRLFALWNNQDYQSHKRLIARPQ